MKIWNKLAKYLANEKDISDHKKGIKWPQKGYPIIASPEKMKIYWNEMENIERADINTDEAWNKVKDKILSEKELSVAPEKQVSLLPGSFWKYAATVLILFGLGIGLYIYHQKSDRLPNTLTVETPSTLSNKKVFLPDGSLAFLNANSSLNYPETFSGNKRSVDIRGEVYFDVKHDPKHPFVIQGEHFQVEVLGSRFNVRANLPEDKVEVYVRSGKVKLHRKNQTDQFIVVEKGYKGIISNNTLKKEKNEDLNYLSWTTGKLIFNDQPLENVLKTVMRAYPVDIRIMDPEIQQYHITTSFSNEPVDTVLHVIATTFNLNMKKMDTRQYILSKE